MEYEDPKTNAVHDERKCACSERNLYESTSKNFVDVEWAHVCENPEANEGSSEVREHSTTEGAKEHRSDDEDGENRCRLECDC